MDLEQILGGTPDTICSIVEAWLPMDTNCCLPSRYERDQS